MNKLALGTAQFGLAYGINNRNGQISGHEAFLVLEEAMKSGVDTLDTAYAYGSSEELIGGFINQQNDGQRFKIISKLPKCSLEEAQDKIGSSLKRMRLDCLYGYLLHDFSMYREKPEIWDLFLALRDQGKAKKIGASFYYPEDLELMLDKRLALDIVQVPYNIFDRRFEDYFGMLHRKNIEIHARSVFLQGLFFIKPQDLDDHFSGIKEKITRLNALSREDGIGIASACLNFVLLNKYIDKAVVGVDSLVHFKEIIKSLSSSQQVNKIYEELSGMKESDQDILLPFNWKIGKN